LPILSNTLLSLKSLLQKLFENPVVTVRQLYSVNQPGSLPVHEMKEASLIIARKATIGPNRFPEASARGIHVKPTGYIILTHIFPLRLSSPKL